MADQKKRKEAAWKSRKQETVSEHCWQSFLHISQTLSDTYLHYSKNE